MRVNDIIFHSSAEKRMWGGQGVVRDFEVMLGPVCYPHGQMPLYCCNVRGKEPHSPSSPLLTPSLVTFCQIVAYY